ncbi:MAG TPA: NRDE family protein [Thermoanaerobaculia bacterium]
MCLIAISIRTGHFPLVIAANRDEDYERPTIPASYWSDAPDIVGGRDRLHGGTWLAINRDGRFAAVTNLRGSARDPRKRSRGELVTAFVRGGATPKQYVNEVASHADEYAGFHLLAGVRDDVMQLSGMVTRLDPGVHALSNAPVGERWPKVATAEAEMKRVSTMADAPQLIDAILGFLSSPRGTNRPESEVFMKGERYGTRSSTAIVMSSDAQLYFAEQSFSRGGVRDGDVRRFS